MNFFVVSVIVIAIAARANWAWQSTTWLFRVKSLMYRHEWFMSMNEQHADGDVAVLNSLHEMLDEWYEPERSKMRDWYYSSIWNRMFPPPQINYTGCYAVLGTDDWMAKDYDRMAAAEMQATQVTSPMSNQM